MALTVHVVTSPGGCRADGGGRFTLATASGRAVLPALELAALPGSGEVVLRSLVPRVDGAPSPLAQAVLDGWRTVRWPERLGGDLRPSFRSSPVPVAVATGGDVTVAWSGSYVVGAADPEELEVSLDLHFAARPTRDDDDTPRHPGFVALDFGTSNCTAVLYDDEHLTMRALDPAQITRLRADLGALLSRAAPPAGTAAQLDALLRRVARAVEPRAVDLTDPARVLEAALAREALGETDRGVTAYREPTVTYTVLLRLEREVAGATEPLRGWLCTRLHACYDAAFDVPPLESLQLFPVELDAQAASLELRSRVIVPASGSLEEAFMPADDAPPAAGARVWSGLKARIGRADDPGPGPGAPGVDALVAAGLRYMVAQSDAFIAANPRRFGRGRTGRVVATYPTVAPPVVRQKLQELLTGPGGPGVRQAVTAYDEAVAAAMFFLMREFSGQLEIGIEAAKARYRPDADRSWKQNVLVIDIGGGTTDIALLTMTLTDRTPGQVRPTPWSGRYYEVTPTVRGSSGFLQLGGEYLTLRVFRWLKAVLVDLLLVTEPDRHRPTIQSLPPAFLDDDAGYRPGSLVERVLHHDGDRAVLDILDDVVPTRWRSAPEHEQAFWLLWTEAETAKLALGRPAAGDHAVPADRVRQVVTATATAAGVAPPALDGLVDGRVVLGAAAFAELLDGPLTQVMQRATNVVLGAFSGERDRPERLDRIILTGKSSALPHVRDALTAHFGRRPDSAETVAWEPSAIEVVEDYSKLATGLGAAWAQSIVWFRRTPEGAVRQLGEGRTHLDIRIENLFASLPAAFGFGEQSQRFAARLKAGKPLYALDDDPVAKARSDDWEQLTENVSVRRELDHRKSSLWASLNIPDFARDQGYDLGDGVWPRQVNALLEIDQNTELAVLLCRGRPLHHVAGVPTIDLAEAIRTVYGPAVLGLDGRLPTRLPGDVLVNPVIAGSAGKDHLAVFRADEELRFDDELVDSDHATAPPVAATGASRVRLLPTPDPGTGADRGGWTFHLVHRGGGAKKIGTLPCPVLGAGLLPTRHLVTLDVTGKLRVHAGAVPFRRATTMREVTDHPGWVLREKLVSAPPDYDEQRDPFNGTH